MPVFHIPFFQKFLGEVFHLLPSFLAHHRQKLRPPMPADPADIEDEIPSLHHLQAIQGILQLFLQKLIDGHLSSGKLLLGILKIFLDYPRNQIFLGRVGVLAKLWQPHLDDQLLSLLTGDDPCNLARRKTRERRILLAVLSFTDAKTFLVKNVNVKTSLNPSDHDFFLWHFTPNEMWQNATKISGPDT